ncbi:hypothetical protein QJS10_CPA01g03030 [Acorus calamus]|uniref:Uncharacterized protein n=1 Tax=Acorus calamus TaxID=4465 RepID=A0AAV9FH63_ACOCL|nr:hypothetical protein QJS10_CPA01g03030 [Acorus calamus]
MGLKKVIVNRIHWSQNSIIAPIKASSAQCPAQTEATVVVDVSGVIDCSGRKGKPGRTVSTSWY